MDLVNYPVAMFQGYLLASFVLGLMLSAKCLVQMAFPQCRASRWVEAIAGLAAFALVFSLALDVLGNDRVLFATAPHLLAISVVGLGLALVAAQLGVSLLHARHRQLALQPVAWVAVVLTLAATAWSSHRYSDGILNVEIEKANYFFAATELS